MTRVVVVCGVCGCGKSTVGERLARELDGVFVDADPFHSDANKAKMASGVALTDEDRASWLAALRSELESRAESGAGTIVLACSALKRKYRDLLASAAGVECVTFVLLRVSEDVAATRVAARTHHFLSTSALVRSQFEALQALEADECGFSVDGEANASEIVSEIAREIQTRGKV